MITRVAPRLPRERNDLVTLPKRRLLGMIQNPLAQFVHCDLALTDAPITKSICQAKKLRELPTNQDNGPAAIYGQTAQTKEVYLTTRQNTKMRKRVEYAACCNGRCSRDHPAL
jgi:hypothetical protein